MLNYPIYTHYPSPFAVLIQGNPLSRVEQCHVGKKNRLDIGNRHRRPSNVEKEANMYVRAPLYTIPTTLSEIA